MITPVHNSISALRAFNHKLNVTADNIANVNTNRFKKSTVQMSDTASGGVVATVHRDNSPGYPVEEVRDGQRIQTESSNVDLAEEIPETIPAQRGYSANLKVIQAQDEMMGSLLDTIG